MKVPMTKNRTKCGIPERKAGDTTKIKVNGVETTFTFLKEVVIQDDDGNIIGVETHWQ